MSDESSRLDSVCVYCGSSNDADPAFIQAANEIGASFAKAGLKLIYGGGGVGLMGATARGAHAAGGRVLGIIPKFLTGREQPFDDVETIVVDNMHERKMMMFEKADAFVVLPGGIGTLEEIIELLSWRRLDLHQKPIVFHNPRGFWDPLFALLQHTIDEGLTPPALAEDLARGGKSRGCDIDALVMGRRILSKRASNKRSSVDLVSKRNACSRRSPSPATKGIKETTMRIFLATLVAVSALSTGAFAAEGAVLKLKAPAKVPSLIQDGAAWRCNGDVCAAPQVKSLPIGRACRKVAAELGAVISFNYRGEALDDAGVTDCNTAAKP